MDIADLHSRLTAPSGLRPIVATAVEQYVFSPISYWCEVNAPVEARDGMDPFQQHIFEVGQKHQADVVNDKYRGAVEKTFTSEDEGFLLALDLLSSGEPYIKNMPLVSRPDGITGRPDVLVRSEEIESDLGPYCYKVVEIKSARNIQRAHKLQGALYNRLIGLVQGYEPSEFLIVNRDDDIFTIKMAEVSDDLDRVLDEMRSIIDGKHVESSYGAGRWPWEQYVDKLTVEANDVSLLPGVGASTRENMIAFGYRTVADVAAANVESLVEIPRIGASTAGKLMDWATAITEHKPVRRQGGPKLPHAETQVFFDFEGTDPGSGEGGLDVTNYLIGALLRQGGEGTKFVPFFADSPDDEKSNTLAFLEWASSLPDAKFFHWHHYEPTHLKKMAEFYRLPEDLVGEVSGRFVDLSPIATRSFAFPAYGEGLKPVARCLGFSWRQDDVTALTSVALYLDYVRSRGRDLDSKRKILDYNEDDCLATMFVYDWLSSQLLGD